MDCQTPPMKLGATGVVETGAGIVLVSEAGCVRLAPHAVDPSAGVSSIHRVGTDAAWHAPLAAALDELHLPRLRALLEARPVESGEWFAEHAAAQLDPDSGCTSRPAWLAWMGSALSAAFVLLWAADERAARRAVLELQLGRSAVATHVLLHHTLHRQLRRSAYEAEDVELLSRACAVKACDAACASSADEGTNEGADDEGPCAEEPWPASWIAALPAPLHPDAAPADACDGLAWATLLVRSGDALERLRARRALAAGDDEAAALKKKEELVDQLRAKDPKAEVDVTHEEQGKYTINKIDFNGHVFLCPVVVDRYSDVKEIVRTATTRCLCC